ncbi:hypothetical protein C1H57_12620 [Clostridium sp. 2-1]|uniref:hypothetical protein n=1 Tax=Clostridium TaxID=1485 RepID=UPI000CDAF3A6|nr:MULTISPECIES: hypothetical protein [Clostridium]MBN7575989.1 hypothetical protein [Clostridium beijerinckii]MBN7581178.1 hypothetical protein [Clostridium beijerinckii]MBN7585710.1 hypothetical protein [Clostridium beijerinckii]MBO0521499.1 hypothetical protein [Clostridium beijerinckii]POO91023.1 hypothetical protein C1H57_12620 [Clostridium sp. 2-1]
MIAIKNWHKEIQQAKEEIIQAKKDAWVNEWRYKNPKAIVVPVPPNIEIKAWFIGQWNTGFVCVAMDELMKLPKKQREKILKLGGL